MRKGDRIELEHPTGRSNAGLLLAHGTAVHPNPWDTVELPISYCAAPPVLRTRKLRALQRLGIAPASGQTAAAVAATHSHGGHLKDKCRSHMLFALRGDVLPDELLVAVRVLKARVSELSLKYLERCADRHSITDG